MLKWGETEIPLSFGLAVVCSITAAGLILTTEAWWWIMACLVCSIAFTCHGIRRLK